MVTIEMMQSMMTGLQEQSRQNMEHLAGQQVLALREIIEKVNAGNKRDGGDVKGIGKPGNFDGKAERFDEWKAKLIAYLRLSTPGCQEWIEWAKDKNELIDEDDVKNEYLGDYFQGLGLRGQDLFGSLSFDGRGCLSNRSQCSEREWT